MNGLLGAGRLIFAIAMLFFGVQFFIFVTGMVGPPPGPPWSRGVMFLDWIACAGFVGAGVCLAAGKMGRWVAKLLGIVLFVYAVLGYGRAWLTRLHDPGPWTVIFEILAMVGGAWILAANFPRDTSVPEPSESLLFRLAVVGRYLIAISWVVFGVQHFLYAGFVASLVPAWIPWHLFWAYFVGVAFIAAALAIAANKMMRLTGVLLGTMFLLWVVVLHLPRVASAPHNGDETTSLFVALAMGGVGFILAGASENTLEGRRV